jgi:mono/diheme cytochrome c family protein
VRFSIVAAALIIAACSDSKPSAKIDSTPAPRRDTTPARPVPSPVVESTTKSTESAAGLVRLPPEPLKAPFTQSTLNGVYTKDEAKEGAGLYMGFCASCHAAVTHTGPVFRQHWAGKPLMELYSFMHTNMPKNDPGSLDDYQYGVLLAYILQMNGMPAGKSPIMGDSVDLTKIRMDTIRLGPGRAKKSGRKMR